jgi:hypothetical protein
VEAEQEAQMRRIAGGIVESIRSTLGA